MRHVDELNMEHPFAGSRMLRDFLRLQGIEVGRRHVGTLMRRMGIQALYRKPNTSKKHPAHPVFPYALRWLAIERANQVWALDITYIPMARGWVYLVAVLAKKTPAEARWPRKDLNTAELRAQRRARNCGNLRRFLHMSVKTPPMRLRCKACRSSRLLRTIARNDRLLAPPVRIFTRTCGT